MKIIFLIFATIFCSAMQDDGSGKRERSETNLQTAASAVPPFAEREGAVDPTNSDNISNKRKIAFNAGNLLDLIGGKKNYIAHAPMGAAAMLFTRGTEISDASSNLSIAYGIFVYSMLAITASIWIKQFYDAIPTAPIRNVRAILEPLRIDRAIVAGNFAIVIQKFLQGDQAWQNFAISGIVLLSIISHLLR